MPLSAGTLIGPYEIISLRGAGGMGEVYRARDTRLDRTVALKILPSTLKASSDLRARFEREARAISALSHPNICALYDIGDDKGTTYLVMEYLEGESLAEKLARGPLPTSLVLRYGAQIAEALQQAHRSGITHRDLKPGNIMITPAGAKLLDFGLAKFIEPRLFSENSAPSTAINPLTAEGTIVGTTSYMSPEQLEGKTLDHRTDIFSLGVILYEMITGQRPFRGDSAASLIASILSGDPPPIRSLQNNVSPGLERIVLTALEKSADERWQTAQDVGRQLRWISESSAVTESSARVQRRTLPLVLWVALGAVAASLLTWGATRVVSPPAPAMEKVSLDFRAPDGTMVLTSPEAVGFALSPQGRTLLFVGWMDNKPSSLFIRPIDSFEVRKVEGSDGAANPFWSSDGEWIGFTARGKLWKTKASGGTPPQPICDVHRMGARASWSGDLLLFSDSRGDRREIYRVPSAGGTAVKVTSLQPGEWKHSWPLLLPDGEHFLYTSFVNDSMERSLILASLESDQRTVLADNVSQARLIARDRVAYVREGNLLTQQFDVAKRVMIGDPAPIAGSVSFFVPTARGEFDASPSGVVVYRTDTSSGRLLRLDRNGSVKATLDDSELYFDHSISRDGRRAAVTVRTRATGLMDIWVYDLVRGGRDRFTSDPGIEVSPSWSPDGRSLVYSSTEGGTFPHLVQRSFSQSASVELTPKGPFQTSASFAPDGESLLYVDDRNGSFDIFSLSLKTKTAAPFRKMEGSQASPAISPDGKWLAYSSASASIPEIYVESLDGGSERIRISTGGGIAPRWSGDGKELFYVADHNAVLSARPNGAGGWHDATTSELFRMPNEILGFAVMPDGQSFLISDTKEGAMDELFHFVIGVR
jgi:eukaryotic-like serine/threonine-protein kinase